jgi:hypothetical protein
VSWRSALRRASLALTLCACGSDGVELPTPPLAQETEAILATYEAPSGSLDVARIDQVVERVKARLDELDIAWLPGLMRQVLVRLRERFEGGGLPADPATPPDPDRARVNAVLDLSHVCSGWSDDPGPPDAATNGSVELTAVVENTQLQHQLWGAATGCRWRRDPLDRLAPDQALIPGINAYLDGTLNLYLYGALPRAGGDPEFFLSFAGELGRERQVRAISFDFRFVNGQIEFRYPVDDGDIIVGIGATTFSLRARNASYTCELATLSCS